MRRAAGKRKTAWFWVGVALLSIITLFWLILVPTMLGEPQKAGDLILGGLFFTVFPIALGIYGIISGRKVQPVEIAEHTANLGAVQPPTATSSPDKKVMGDERLIGGLMSCHLARGKWRGYGIYATTRRLIGVVGGWKERFGPGLAAAAGAVGGAFAGGPVGAGVGAGMGLRVGEQLTQDQNAKAIEELEEKKDIEVTKDDLQEVILEKRKGAVRRYLTHYANLVIKTSTETYHIKIGSANGKGEFHALRDLLTVFDSSKLRVIE